MLSASAIGLSAQEERGEIRAFSSPQILELLDGHHVKYDREQLGRLGKAIAEASLICLRKCLEKYIRKGNLTDVMLISAEFTRRGIAPCFRYRRALISSIPLRQTSCRVT